MAQGCLKCPEQNGLAYCDTAPKPTPGTTCTGSAFSAALPLTECSAWQEFFDATEGTQWLRFNATRVDPCAAIDAGYGYGVKCSVGYKDHDHVRITEINFGTTAPGLYIGNNLQGTIPAVIKDFTELGLLGLSNNAIQGTIPTELAELKHLGDLFLDGNQLTGRVPELTWSQYYDRGAGKCQPLTMVAAGPNRPW